MSLRANYNEQLSHHTSALQIVLKQLRKSCKMSSRNAKTFELFFAYLNISRRKIIASAVSMTEMLAENKCPRETDEF